MILLIIFLLDKKNLFGNFRNSIFDHDTKILDDHFLKLKLISNEHIFDTYLALRSQ